MRKLASKKELLPTVKELHWVVYIYEINGLDNILRRQWVASTPTIVSIDFKQSILESNITNNKKVYQEDFENILKKEKVIESGTVSTANYKGEFKEHSLEQCWKEFHEWTDKLNIPNDNIVICNNYEEHSSQLRLLYNDIIQGKKFSQFPFNAAAGYKLWGNN